MLLKPYQSNWLMVSDVCKHCKHAGCLEACSTDSLFRTEFGTVVVQQDICNGCGYCVPSCPFGVIELNEHDGKAHKCTLCYDRLKGGLEPACAKSCPTNSIQFEEVDTLLEHANQRVQDLHRIGRTEVCLYGSPGGRELPEELKRFMRSFCFWTSRKFTILLQMPSLPASRINKGLGTGVAVAAGIGVLTGLAFAASKKKL